MLWCFQSPHHHTFQMWGTWQQKAQHHSPWIIFFTQKSHTIPEANGLLTSHYFLPQWMPPFDLPPQFHLATTPSRCKVCDSTRQNATQHPLVHNFEMQHWWQSSGYDTRRQTQQRRWPMQWWCWQCHAHLPDVMGGDSTTNKVLIQCQTIPLVNNVDIAHTFQLLQFIEMEKSYSLQPRYARGGEEKNMFSTFLCTKFLHRNTGNR